MKTFRNFRREATATEIQHAKQSNLKSRRIDNHVYKVTLHAAFRAHSRNENMSHDDWNQFLNNAHQKMKRLSVGKYLVTSKKHDQSVAINKINDTQSDVVTVFVKGTHRLRPDTNRVMVEHFSDFAVYIEIE